MTLREKFEKANNTVWLRNEAELVKIADEFSIGFAEWLNFNFKLDFSDKAFEELLLVYKKEKGL
jgi:hypothetical protein